MPSPVRPLLNQLEAIETQDEVLTVVAARTREILGALEPGRMPDGLRLFVADFRNAEEPLRSSVYYTESCQAILRLRPPAVVVNAAFLLELEAAFRSFDLSESLLDSQYLRGDEDLFGLVKRIQHDPTAYLLRLRKLDVEGRKRDRAYLIETLTMVALFFIGHEIGHLLNKAGERSYATFLRPDAPLEDRVANAVEKLCRHVDEFAEHGFTLPGGEEAIRFGGGVRERARELSEQLDPELRKTHVQWFRDEVSADEAGSQLLTDYLAGVARRDPFLADQYRYVTIKGIFAAALYSWYGDLLTFGMKMGLGDAPDSRALMMRMLKSRETYINAASLFGDVHRFTLLRAALAVEAIIRSGSDFFDQPEERRTIWWPKGHTQSNAVTGDGRKWWQRIFAWQPTQQEGEDRDVVRGWWQAESLQRYYLLCIHMDTSVKIAYLGCSTGWILEVDRKRGTPQLFFMGFESIRSSVERLRCIQ